MTRFKSVVFVFAAALLSALAANGAGIPVGTVRDFAGVVVPEGYLKCDGSAVSRTQYKRLFDVIKTKYGSGDGKTTFNLPNCSGRVSQSPTAKYALGSTIPAGVPNIWGRFTRNVNNGFVQDNVLFQAINYGGSSSGYQNGYASGVEFNANRYNPIYGNSDTVQPAAVVFNKIIRY